MILSVCIPTYGQPQQIRRTLDSLLGQDLQDIEIVIRDDNADAETETIISHYVSRLPIRYFHLEKEGVDLAFLFVSKEARGKFVWWFGDDVFCPGTVGRVVDALKRNSDVDFMYVNSTDMSGEGYSVNLGGSRLTKDRNEVLSELKDQLGFCSAMLFKKTILLSGMEKAQEYVGTSWVTLFLSMNALAEGSQFYLLDGKNFLSDPKLPGESRWYDSFEVHGINYSLVALEFKGYFDKKLLRHVLAQKFGRSWRAVIVERALGLKTGFASPSPKIMKMAKLYWNYPECYISLPLMLLPRSILQVFYAIYKRIKVRMPIEPCKSLVAESTKAVAVVCPHDGAVVLGVSTTLYRCPLCRRDYSLESGVLRMLGSNEEFYEGVYGNPIKFLPKSERPWHIWPLWLINSGYLWMVRRHVPEYSVVLELGCAAGVRYFGKRYHMIGYDISFASLLKTRGEYAQLLQADALTCICLPDKSVDAVVSSFFWEHIQPDIKPRILSECSRVLRPGGKVVFLYDVGTENPLIRHYKQVNPALYSRLFIECDRHVGYQRPADNLALFRAAGFSVLEHRGMEKTWFQSPTTYGKLMEFGSTARRLFAWTNVLGRPPWFYLYTAWMRLIDTVICPLLPRDYARIDLVVLKKESL